MTHKKGLTRKEKIVLTVLVVSLGIFIIINIVRNALQKAEYDAYVDQHTQIVDMIIHNQSTEADE